MVATQLAVNAGAPVSRPRPASIKRKNWRNEFDPVSFLTTAGVGRKRLTLSKKDAQGEPAR